MRTSGSSAFPVIRRFTPYAPQNSRASTAPSYSAPFSGQDLASQLLYQQQQRAATTPSSNFQDNFNYDPIQTKIQALGAQSVANAQTNAAQLRKEAAINEGDPELLKSLGFDQNTIDAAQNNPQSLLAQLNLEYQNRQNQLRDAMQAQNLYYSGEYQKNLTNLTQGKAVAEGSLGQKLRDLLSGADSGVLDSQEAARQADLQQQLQAQQQEQADSLYASLLEQLGLGINPTDTGNNTSPGYTSSYVPSVAGMYQNPPINPLNWYLGMNTAQAPRLY